MSLATMLQSKRIVGPAQVYLVTYPTGGYTGGSDALKLTALKALFFSDSATDACRLVTPSAYSDMDASGVQIKLKQGSVEFDSNLAGKYKLSSGPTEGSVTFQFKDLDSLHMIDAFSALTGDIFTTAAGASIAGRKTVRLGSQTNPLFVAAMIRYTSELNVVGGTAPEYNYILCPYCSMSPDLDIKIDKKSAATAKIQLELICDYSLQGTAPIPPIAYISEVTAVATS
jgi:hypothetical protein